MFLKRTRQALLGTLLLVVTALASSGASAPRFGQSFDFDWRFHLGDLTNAAAPELADSTWRQLDLPHDFSREGEFASNNLSSTAFLPGGVAWYRKAFVLPADWQSKLVSIEFDGVSMNSEVWINGHSLGKRPYAYSSFAYDLTPHLRRGQTNLLAVRVDRSAIDDSRYYTGSGIYRHVRLVATEKVHVARHGVYITTPQAETNRARVTIQTRIQNQAGAPAEVELITDLLNPEGQAVGSLTNQARIAAGGDTVLAQNLEVATPRLWSPETPALYTARTIVRLGNQITDQLPTAFGIRSIRFDAQQGFFLNGKPAKFKGVCLHHDAGALGVAVPDKTLERRLRLVKELGCNAVRCSHNPMAAEFYDLCDRLGLMVMDEAFDEWTGAKRKWVQGWNVGTASVLHGYSNFFEQWAEADVQEMVLRGRNHPSIVLWSIGNEIDYPNDPYTHPANVGQYDPKRPSAEILAQAAPRLIKAVRECDPTRPITAGLANVPASNATGLADLLDVVGYNYQLEHYEKDMERYPRRKLVGTENGYEMGYYDITQNPRVSGQFLWIGIDYLGEARRWPERGWDNGLLNTCGFKKPRAAFRESLWSEKPMVYVCVRTPERDRRARSWQGDFGWQPVESHWNWAEDSRSELPVEVYSNCEGVELFLNGKSLGGKTRAEAERHIFRWKVPFQPGELKAIGRPAGQGQPVEYRLVTAGQPARLELLADQTTLAADGRDVAHVELRLVDEQGVLVPAGNALCAVNVTGAARLLAIDNGNQLDLSPLTATSRKLNRGRALATLQSLRQPGPITFTVTASNLPPATLKLQSIQ